MILISGCGGALQSNGKTVIAGDGGSDNRYPSGFALGRLGADGVPDPGFGSGGSVTMPIGTGAAAAEAVAILPDGRIVVDGAASATFTGGTDSNSAVARYFGDAVAAPSR